MMDLTQYKQYVYNAICYLHEKYIIFLTNLEISSIVKKNSIPLVQKANYFRLSYFLIRSDVN